MERKHLINIIGFVLFVWILAIFSCSSPIPDDVKKIIQRSENERELYSAIHHYIENPNDSLKLASLYILIRGMEQKGYHTTTLKFSQDVWDSLNVYSFFKNVYSDSMLKSRYAILRKMDPAFAVDLNEIKYDLQTITSQYLIENIDYAFQVRKESWAKNLSFIDFCELVLPYRSEFEPLNAWRKTVFQGLSPWMKKLQIQKYQRLRKDSMHYYLDVALTYIYGTKNGKQ